MLYRYFPLTDRQLRSTASRTAFSEEKNLLEKNYTTANMLIILNSQILPESLHNILTNPHSYSGYVEYLQCSHKSKAQIFELISKVKNLKENTYSVELAMCTTFNSNIHRCSEIVKLLFNYLNWTKLPRWRRWGWARGGWEKERKVQKKTKKKHSSAARPPLSILLVILYLCCNYIFLIAKEWKLPNLLKETNLLRKEKQSMRVFNILLIIHSQQNLLILAPRKIILYFMTW